MKYLLDTHILLWVARDDNRISPALRELLADDDNELVISVVSVWEIVIKSSLGRPDFAVDARQLRDRALDAGYHELDVAAPHVLEIANLQNIHNDPFDRLLLAQAMVEQATLISVDKNLVHYGPPVMPAV